MTPLVWHQCPYEKPGSYCSKLGRFDLLVEEYDILGGGTRWRGIGYAPLEYATEIYGAKTRQEAQEQLAKKVSQRVTNR